MDGDDFGIRDERDGGKRDDDPVSGVENEQGDERGEQAQAVKFCQQRMCGGKFSEPDEADGNAARFRQQHQRDQPEICHDDGATQNPRGGEDEQVINDVGDAVVAAKGRGGHAKFAGEDAVKNVRERGGNEDGQINPARNIRQRASQGDWAEQQPQGCEREWQVAFHSTA